MIQNIKKILFVLGCASLCLNLLSAILVKRNKNQSSIEFFNPAVIENTPYLSASCIVSVPTESDGASIEFGTITLKLVVNESAYLQFNSMYKSNTEEVKTTLQNNYIYDREIINVENNKITALKSGAVFLQVFTNEGIKDVCYIMIKDKTE